MKLQVAVVATAAGLAVAAPHTRSTGQYPGCTGGQGKREYDQGVRLASSAFTTSWNFLDQDCGLLDTLVGIMDETAPYKPYCKNLGYTDALYSKYADAQGQCFTDCKDSGEMTGYALAAQFCAVAQQQAMALTTFAAPPTTLAICNEVEKKKCESKYASEVNKKCPECKEQYKDFYNELKKSCDVSTPLPPADNNPPCDACGEQPPPPPPTNPCVECANPETPAKPTPTPKPTVTSHPGADNGAPDSGIDCTTPGSIDTRC